MIKQEDKPESSYLRQQTILWLKRVSLTLIAFSFAYIVLELGSSQETPSKFSISDNVYKADIEDIPVEEDQEEIISQQVFTPFTYTEVSVIDDVLVEEIHEVNVIDGDQLNVDLIEKKLNPTSEKISTLAEETTTTTLYPNGNSIFESFDEIESTYEEELPEGEFVEEDDDMSPEEEAEALKNGYHIYRDHKKITDIKINIKHKPPYFGPHPVIAIVIDDMGISPQRTKDIISINAPITSSFLTYSDNLSKQIKKAKNAGHEILVHVPMQAKSNVDEAPDVLKVDMTEKVISKNFEKMLKKFNKADIKGVNNHMGSLFTEHGEKLAPVMEILNKEDLFFLDSKTSAKSEARKAAEDHNVRYVHRQVFLDNVNNVEYINKQLQLAEDIAHRNGYAVAIGHPKSGTYEALRVWTDTLPDKNIKLVHLSEIVDVLNPKKIEEEIITDDDIAED